MRNSKWAKALVLALTLAMCVWTLSACGSSSGGDEPADKGETEKVAESDLYTNSDLGEGLVMSEAIRAFYDAIDTEYAVKIADELAYNWDDYGDFLGWRSAGSDSEHATADYLAKEMEKLGLKNVDKVATPCDKFQFNSSSLKIADTDICYDSGEQEAAEKGLCAPASYQVSGTDGDLTAEIIDLGMGYEADFEGKDVEGKIGLIQVDQSAEMWINGPINMASEKGLAAIVTWSNSGYGEAGNYTINVQDVCCADLMPTVAISAKQAKQIKKAIKDGHSQCTLNVDAEMVDNGGTTYNVCGMIPGKNHDQKIIVAGHYDKYWYGYQDDCLAIGLVLDVAKAMVDSGYAPENDIYFICHGAEEWGVSDTMFDWTTGAWGMVDDKNMGDGTIALLNCELPALDMEAGQTIPSVPEFYALKNKLFDKKAVITDGKASFNTANIPVTTMEDGISYREYGVPYFLNGFEGTDFMCQRYHTIADSKDTYNEDTFKTNVNWYGAYAIYIDAMPALELDMSQTAKELKAGFDEKLAKEAGVDPEEYMDAVNELYAAGKAMNKKIDACNTAYEEAINAGDKETAAQVREEGKALNEKTLAAFQTVQDSFLKVTDFGADYGHTTENANVALLDGVLNGLEKGEIWAEDEESGAADNAWKINSMLDYSYCVYSKEVSDKAVSMYADSYYGNKDQAQWSWHHNPSLVKVGDLSYELFRAESVDDIEDIDAMKEGYKAARDAQISEIGNWCAQEIKDMRTIATMLK